MITQADLIGPAIVLGVSFAVLMVLMYRIGYERARNLFKPDAMRWRRHDRNVCADREAFVRFTHTMREMTEASDH